MNRERAVVFAQLRGEREVKTIRQFRFAATPPDSLMGGFSIGYREAKMLLVSTQSAGRAIYAQIAGGQLDRGIPLASWIDPLQQLQNGKTQFFQTHFPIKAQRAVQRFGWEASSGKLVESIPEIVQSFAGTFNDAR